MSEIWKIILTSFATIIGGVLIYVSGQIISKFFIATIHEQWKIIGEIADALVFYANIYCNPGLARKEKKDEAKERFRQLATLLQSKTHLIPWYKFFSIIKILKSLSNIEKASQELIGLSNSMHITPTQIPNISIENSKRADRIRELLGIEIKI